MNVPAENSPDSELRIYFPARKREYAYFSELVVNPDLRTEVLQAQRDYQHQSRDPARYARCMCCDNPLARYVVKALAPTEKRIRYFLARFPNSGHNHSSSCKDFKDDLLSPPPGGQPEPDLRPGDLSPLIKGVQNPGNRKKIGDSNVRTFGTSSNRQRQSQSAASLRMLGRILLEESGICACTPGYVKHRGFREVNGLVFGALRRLQENPHSHYGNMYGKLLGSVPSNVTLGPWSLPKCPAADATGASQVTLGFGFVISIGPSTDQGGRLFTLANAQERPLLVPANILAKAATIAEFPADNDQLSHPTWALFIAACFSDVWWAIRMTCFRMSEIGLIPVESDPEEKMVEYLIRERRTFRRCLLPPEDGCKFVPDFLLTDTFPQSVLEVAGRTDEAYLRQIQRKRQHWKDQVIVWHARDSFPQLPQKAAAAERTLLPEEIPSGAPRLPVEAERLQAACT